MSPEDQAQGADELREKLAAEAWRPASVGSVVPAAVVKLNAAERIARAHYEPEIERLTDLLDAKTALIALMMPKMTEGGQAAYNAARARVADAEADRG